jgi:hypothetical protein
MLLHCYDNWSVRHFAFRRPWWSTNTHQAFFRGVRGGRGSVVCTCPDGLAASVGALAEMEPRPLSPKIIASEEGLRKVIEGCPQLDKSLSVGGLLPVALPITDSLSDTSTAP